MLATLELQQRAALLPNTGGVSATIIVTVDADTYAGGAGLATTGHGALVPAQDAMRWGGGEGRDRSPSLIDVIVHEPSRTDTRRIAVRAQLLDSTRPSDLARRCEA